MCSVQLSFKEKSVAMIGLRSLVGLGIVTLLLLANLEESNAKLMAKSKVTKIKHRIEFN